MVECIGEYNQQIKPVSAQGAKPDSNNIIADIDNIFPDKPAKYDEREPKEFKDKFK